MASNTITETRVALTTTDNPFDPLDDFNSWYDYDMFVGKHNTCGYLDRVSHYSDDMTEKEKTEELERAIDEIMEINPLNIYRKIKRDVQVVID